MHLVLTQHGKLRAEPSGKAVASLYNLISYIWAPKEISAALKVREVRYLIKHQFVERKRDRGKERERGGEGRGGGEGGGREGREREGGMAALSWDPDRVFH